ncbi:MAG: MarC family protein [Candidatus Methanomethylicia archaeon]
MYRNILDQLVSGKHKRIFKLSIATVILAILVLAYTRVTAKGIYEIIYFNPLQAANISLQLFAIINPLSALPLFLTYTGELPIAEWRKLVNTIVTVVVALIFSFTLLGQLILSLLGITIESFKLAGGVLLMVLAIDMLGEL